MHITYWKLVSTSKKMHATPLHILRGGGSAHSMQLMLLEVCVVSKASLVLTDVCLEGV